MPTPPSSSGSCPIDALKLNVCANTLNLLKLNLPVGNDQCCPLLQGLVDLDAAICLCTAIKANVLGININADIDLSILLNHCGKTCPEDFKCVVLSCEPSCPTPTPPVAPSPLAMPTPPSSSGSCPIDALKLNVCANVLNFLKLNLPVGNDQCCPLLQGLVDLDAAICLCTAIKANVLGINLNADIDLSILLNHCGKTCPEDFKCPSN
nr:unnamed protein product [Digitaria exilis]